MEKNENASSVLGEMSPSKAIVKLAVPATLALQYGCRGCFSCNNHFPVPYLWHFHLVLCQRTLHYQNQTTAVIQICLSVASSLTNIAAAGLPQSDEIIAAFGVVQRLVLIGSYVIMGFMQSYQPVAAFAFGAKRENRFHQSVRFALKGSLVLTLLVTVSYILFAKPLILLFNNNPVIVDYGKWLLISQVALFPAFGLCYMMTITYQTIGASGYGLFLSLLRQGLFYVPFIIILPKLLGVNGIYLSQPLSDILTTLVCIFSIKKMKSLASENMQKIQAQ